MRTWTSASKSLLATVAFVAALAPSSGCGQAAKTAVDSAAAKSAAEALAERYFEAARSQDWSAIDALYHPRFFESLPWETWSRVLPNVDRELGRLGTCSQDSWNVSKKVSTEFTGTVVSLGYTCQHERYAATVSFTIARASDEDAYSIYSQNFNSIGFLIE